MQLEIEKLIEQIKRGNLKAFKNLVEQNQKYAFQLAFRILCEEEEAKDVVQESFIKIWKNIENYNSKVKFKSWMYKIVTNSAIDRLRAIKKVNIVKIEDVSEKLEKMNYSGLEVQLDNQEAGNLIRKISDRLPEKQRIVFILRDLQGFESIEVENILGLDETSVKSNLYHARKAVKTQLIKILNYEGRLS